MKPAIEKIVYTLQEELKHKRTLFINHYTDYFIKTHPVEEIKDFIYKSFYLQNEMSDLNDEKIYVESFLHLLRKSNLSRNKLHRKWIIEHINNDGSIIAARSRQRLAILPGNYLMMSSHTNYPFLNAPIALYQNREFLSENDIFYHVFGECLDEQFYEAMVRFYFNLSPKGAIEMVFILTKELNKLKIPFHFKCLKNPSIYQRSDTSILYLDKRFFRDFTPLLANICEKLLSYIRQPTPLFTLPICPGVAFAENPPNPNESFGTCRCRLIAEGIWEAYQNQLPDEVWSEYVIRHIEKQGYQLDKFYLNPHSRFHYYFE